MSAGRLVGSLTLAGLVSGLLLAAVHVLTEPVIADNRAEALSRAVLAVVPGAAEFDRFASAGAGVYVVRDGAGHPLGYAIEAEGPGFMDTIRLLYGLDGALRHVVGLQILDSRETPGLGDKIMTDPSFVGSFTRLRIAPAVVPVTTGAPTADNQVDCIAGATISSRAVVRILQQSLEARVPQLALLGTDGGERD